jgi:hypothetical protein
MTLERDIDGIQLPGRLLGGDAAAGRDQRPEALIVDELPKLEAVYPLSAGRVGTVVWAHPAECPAGSAAVCRR